MLLPMAAAQLAATSAVIVPPVLTMFVTVMPAGTVMAVTVKLPAAVSASLTVAMVELMAALPCWRASVETVEKVGGISNDEFATLNKSLHRLERFWTDQILYRL